MATGRLDEERAQDEAEILRLTGELEEAKEGKRLAHNALMATLDERNELKTKLLSARADAARKDAEIAELKRRLGESH